MSNSQMEALDLRYLLLEYYKKLRLSEQELAVILMIDHFLDQKNTLITPDLLSMRMSLSVKEIDKIFVTLIERGLLIFDTGKKIKVSLKPLQKKLYDLFEKELAKEKELSFNEAKADALNKLYETFEKQLGRQLSPLEISLINDWVDHGYKPETIIDALASCLSAGKKTLRSIDKLLLQWQTRDDIEKTGFTTTSDKWDKDIEKTMEIARAKWIDD